MTTAPRPCPVCDNTDALRVEAGVGYEPRFRFHAYCDACYDGAPDAGYYPVGYGETEEAAVQDWAESAELV